MTYITCFRMYHVSVFFYGWLRLLVGGKPFFHMKHCFCKSIPIPYLCARLRPVSTRQDLNFNSVSGLGELEIHEAKESTNDSGCHKEAPEKLPISFLEDTRDVGWLIFGDIVKNGLKRTKRLVSEQQSKENPSYIIYV